MEQWPFEDPPDVATITVRPIVEGKKPILLVVRYAGDEDSWSFLTGEEFRMSEAMVVGFGEMLTRDPTLAELADLLPGWCASRERVGAPWQREPDESE